MHDVARAAGVSPMTVSRVLSRTTKVSSKSQLRVREAIQKLGYSPNIAARNLARASSVHIGLLYNNPSAAYLNAFLVGVLEQSRQTWCQIVLKECGTRIEGNTVKGLLAEGWDGVILPPPLSDSRTLIDSLHKAALPFVAVASGYSEEECLAVRISDKDAAAAMTRYLISLGHRKIGFILGASNQRASHQRYEGFATALLDASIEIRSEWIRKGSFSYRSGLIAAEQILAATDRPTALFASNDDMAAGAVAVAHKLHLEVPGHLSIVGFDDTPLATTIWPTLTTIRQPITAMARKALEMLLREITLRRQGKTLAPRQQFLKFSLVKRESSGPFNPHT
jgi:LacI family transcriptional regulator